MIHKKQRGRLESSAGALSRNRGSAHYQQKRLQERRHHLIRGILTTIIAVVVCVGLAFASFYFDIDKRLASRISPDLAAELSDPQQAGDPFYILLLGIDKSDDRAQDWGDDDSNFRTDTIILARVDPKNLKITLISIARDTLVDLGEYGQQKINAAYSFGGPALTVKTVEKYAHVDINHYAEVDFDTLTKIVDTIGGIEVNVPVDVVDPLANANIKAGEQTLNGQDALALCRSRHAYDDYGAGDFYRAANQRMVISAIIKKVLASNPFTIASTIENLADGVSTDLDVSQIVSLAMQMRNIDVENNVYSGMNPTEGQYIDGVSYQITDQAAWNKMMQRVNNGETPYEHADDDPTYGVAGSVGNAGYDNDGNSTTADDSSSESGDYTGSVEVLNGSGVAGAAATAAQSLTSAGFTTTTGTAASYNYTGITVIYQGSQNKAKAQAVADTLSNLGTCTVTEDTSNAYRYNTDILVVIGS